MTSVVFGVCPSCGVAADAVVYDRPPVERAVACRCGSKLPPVPAGTPGRRVAAALFARGDLPRTTSLVFWPATGGSRGRAAAGWETMFTTPTGTQTRWFMTQWGCRRFARKFGRNAAFAPEGPR